MGVSLTDLVRQLGLRLLGGDEQARFLADLDALEAPDTVPAATVPADSPAPGSSQSPSPEPGTPAAGAGPAPGSDTPPGQPV